MLKVELIPDLTHCIETVARIEHATILKQLLRPGQRNKVLEEKLEIIRLFLETSDFKRLRAESEKRLMNGEKIRFLVYLDNEVKYEIQVT
ncbi:hypothetical protein ACFLWZ_06435 [Chloroflexota bacterium]